MKPAADRLREKLAATAISAPAIPVVNNIDVAVGHDVQVAFLLEGFGQAIQNALCQCIQTRE